MLLGLIERAENHFVGNTLDGAYIKVSNFALDEKIQGYLY